MIVQPSIPIYAGVTFASFLALIAERRSVRRNVSSLADWRECALASLLWPILAAALCLGMSYAALERFRTRRTADALHPFPAGSETSLSIANIARSTLPHEQAVPLVVVIGGIGKVRLAAKAGLTPAYSTADPPPAGWEMTYIGEVEALYPQRWNGVERRRQTKEG